MSTTEQAGPYGLPSTSGRVVVVTGAGGPTGEAVAARLAARGDTVIGAGLDEAPGVHAVDLADPEAVRAFAARVAEEHGRADGVVHLVGGWRGSKTFAETDLADWDFLHRQLVRTLQHVTLAFEPLLRDSPDARFAIVSATAAARPTQGNAAYAAAKAAAEAWTLAFADALRDTPAAATILVIKALVNDAMRAASPERKFPGYTDVKDLAEAVAALWDRPAGEVNGLRWDLTS
ncbi:oxidoreductase [Sphaerisporangium siamense]|uniref:NAD(P)-dependent dehydrogenase (Short-subunit alcohol dehydrogenase family) n=1 Tax=Sphaerisporangium siamense TaxID=795645 RepID=A0A7W7DDX8_9ACTN|nr:SDR family NAD(P)-dependent oxidoreductase [Sphaerisporangium siamense]MBB4705042.1 NAD(P)-dependent dehydrogenase (short-subunit alcohol dehydrogenase family) [Sphaerisporangium siamense]GII83848.1 oxidoreductase [Sphaerisporangium siamense]